jgi:hypothetical protein
VLHLPGPTRSLMFLLSACTAGCAGPSHDQDPAAVPPRPRTDPQGQRVARAACRALLDAPPGRWSEALPAVLATGATGCKELMAALLQTPDAPGTQVALAALGRMGAEQPETAAFLLQWVERRLPHHVDATLALGQHQPAGQSTVLSHLVEDRIASSSLRCAAAASLIRLGHAREVADLVRAVLLADTPQGRDLQQRQGLASKTRWAHDRYLLIDALRDVAGTDFGIDTDAPWPLLQAAADRVQAWIETLPEQTSNANVGR